MQESRYQTRVKIIERDFLSCRTGRALCFMCKIIPILDLCVKGERVALFALFPLHPRFFV